jgi:hypothetical protein
MKNTSTFQGLPKVVMGLLVLICIMPWAILAGYRVSPEYFLLAFPILLFMLWISTIVHELGHLLAALLMGLRIQEIVIEPLQIVRKGRAVRFRLAFSQRAGHVIAYPRDANRIRLRMMVFIAGGPVANLLVSLGCLVLASWVDSASPPLVPSTDLSYWLDFAVLTNVACFVANLMKGKSGQIPSDGSQLHAYQIPGSRAEFGLLRLTLNDLMLSGTRPSAWNASLVERMLTLRDGSPDDLSANLLGYYHALDTKRRDLAGIYLDLAVAAHQTAEPRISDAILLEKAYFEAFHRQSANARTWLDQVQRQDNEKHTRWRAEAAVLFIEGRYAEASAKAKAAIAEVPNLIDRGGSIAESDWLQVLLEESEKLMIPNNAQDLVPTTGRIS